MNTLEYGAGAITAYVITCLICYVISALGLGKMFEKGGEPGWKAWIPCYNGYITYKLTWNKNVFWLVLIGAVLLSIIAAYNTLNVSVIMTVIQVILWIALLILQITASYKISKAYGHGIGYTIGLIFLPIIFYLIIGFGSSEYKRA